MSCNRVGIARSTYYNWINKDDKFNEEINNIKKIEDKMALRIVQNAIITLTDCVVTEENRLQNCNSFKDTAKVLQ